MGSGSWSTNTYRATTAAYSTKSREEIFHQRSLYSKKFKIRMKRIEIICFRENFGLMNLMKNLSYME